MEAQFIKYGNLWRKFDRKRFTPDWWVAIIGGNDTDDFWGFTMRLLAENGSEMYEDRVDDYVQNWLDALIPYIVDFFVSLVNRASSAKIAYVPILPRTWWCEKIRELASRINKFIERDLRIDYGIRVKSIFAVSLHD